jgi:hypothetical protein
MNSYIIFKELKVYRLIYDLYLFDLVREEVTRIMPGPGATLPRPHMTQTDAQTPAPIPPGLSRRPLVNLLLTLQIILEFACLSSYFADKFVIQFLICLFINKCDTHRC